MWVMITGVLLLGAVLAIFYLKDRLESQWLARLAYHELTMRVVVIAAALVFFGAIMVIGDLIG